MKRKEDIPIEDRIYEENSAGERVVAGYRRGWEFSLRTHTIFPGTISARYGSYTGPTGAWSTSGVFVWFLGFWVRVWSGGIQVA